MEDLKKLKVKNWKEIAKDRRTWRDLAEKAKTYKGLQCQMMLMMMIDQIPKEPIKAGGTIICYEIHKLINYIWNKEELPEEWKQPIIAPTYKNSDKTDCINYRGISRLSTTYKILSNILLSQLTPYAEEIIWDHQCGFRRNRSTTDHILCISQIL